MSAGSLKYRTLSNKIVAPFTPLVPWFRPIYTSSAWTCPNYINTLSAVVIGGGGGGGAAYTSPSTSKYGGYGGNGCPVIYTQVNPVSGRKYIFVIGAGGTGGVSGGTTNAYGGTGGTTYALSAAGYSYLVASYQGTGGAMVSNAAGNGGDGSTTAGTAHSGNTPGVGGDGLGINLVSGASGTETATTLQPQPTFVNYYLSAGAGGGGWGFTNAVLGGAGGKYGGGIGGNQYSVGTVSYTVQPFRGATFGSGGGGGGSRGYTNDYFDGAGGNQGVVFLHGTVSVPALSTAPTNNYIVSGLTGRKAYIIPPFNGSNVLDFDTYNNFTITPDSLSGAGCGYIIVPPYGQSFTVSFSANGGQGGQGGRNGYSSNVGGKGARSTGSFLLSGAIYISAGTQGGNGVINTVSGGIGGLGLVNGGYGGRAGGTNNTCSGGGGGAASWIINSNGAVIAMGAGGGGGGGDGATSYSGAGQPGGYTPSSYVATDNHTGSYVVGGLSSYINYSAGSEGTGYGVAFGSGGGGGGSPGGAGGNAGFPGGSCSGGGSGVSLAYPANGSYTTNINSGDGSIVLSI